MENPILIVITSIISSGIFSFIYKEWIKNRFNRDLAKFKNDLQQENQKLKSEIEIQQIKFKSELTRVENEHHTRFAQTYSIKAQMIRELYQKLIIAEKSFISLLKPLQMAGEESEDEKANIASKNGNDLMNFFYENEIIFDESICKTIDQINTMLIERWTEYTVSNLVKKSGGSPTNEFVRKGIDNYDETFKKTIPALKEELKKKFREELGIKEKADNLAK